MTVFVRERYHSHKSPTRRKLVWRSVRVVQAFTHLRARPSPLNLERWGAPSRGRSASRQEMASLALLPPTCTPEAIQMANWCPSRRRHTRHRRLRWAMAVPHRSNFLQRRCLQRRRSARLPGLRSVLSSPASSMSDNEEAPIIAGAHCSTARRLMATLRTVLCSWPMPSCSHQPQRQMQRWLRRRARAWWMSNWHYYGRVVGWWWRPRQYECGHEP